ncbi:MAG: succinylglutamate desuccinylase/aspartoacylase family protein [Synergistes sp.]|nr:succinylglutamate desuccinylase/aspartoacylase family protein [Synergistes sp.]
MGGKKTEVLHIPVEGNDIKEIDLPVALIIGDEPGPEAVITAGMIPGEFSGVLAAIKLLHEISPADIKGSLKILTVCDVADFKLGTPIPTYASNSDLNHSFPGQLRGGYYSLLAAKIFDEIKGADYHIDLHGSEAYERSVPFAAYHRGRRGELNDRSHEMAYYFGAPNIMITETEGRWSDKGCCYSSVYEGIGIPSVLFHIGGLNMAFSEAVRIHMEGVKNVLRRFGTLRGTPQPVGRPQIFENMEIVRAAKRGIYYRRIRAGDMVKRGQLIGLITDCFGTVIEKLVSPVNGKVLYMTESSSIPGNGFVAAVGVSFVK